jgi:hypothetical protein
MTKSFRFRNLAAGLIRGCLLLTFAIGYFFGFTIVSILTMGLCTSEEFEVLVHGRKQHHRFPVFNQHGQYFLQADYVAFVGWTLLATVIVFVIG